MPETAAASFRSNDDIIDEAIHTAFEDLRDTTSSREVIEYIRDLLYPDLWANYAADITECVPRRIRLDQPLKP